MTNNEKNQHLWVCVQPSTDPEPVTVKATEITAKAANAVVLSFGAGLLNINNYLWCISRQNQRASIVLYHHIVFDPDSQSPEALRCLVIVLGDVQPYDCDWKWKCHFFFGLSARSARQVRHAALLKPRLNRFWISVTTPHPPQQRKEGLTRFYSDGHSWLKRLRAGQFRSVMDVHAQVMANMVRAVSPRGLR